MLAFCVTDCIMFYWQNGILVYVGLPDFDMWIWLSTNLVGLERCVVADKSNWQVVPTVAHYYVLVYLVAVG